jgi:hypothetical protein
VPECAICGRHVEGLETVTVEVEFTDKEKYGPRPDEYYLHAWCAENVFGSWQKPG